MPPSKKVVAIGAVAVIAYDAVTALASHQFGFAYTRAAVGSYLLYAMVGYFAAKSDGLRSAVRAGATIGLIDASVGWAVSWAIGPGRPSNGALTPVPWLVIAVIVASSATICAAIGSAVYSLTSSRSAPVH